MQKVGFLFLLVLLVMPLSLQAQGNCDINLEDEVNVLKDAQSQADSGDAVAAATTLQELSATLSAIAEGCLGDDDTLEVAIDEIAMQEFVAEDGSIAFLYPENWVLQDENEGAYLIATSAEVIDAIDDELPESLDVGDRALGIISIPLAGQAFDEIASGILNDFAGDSDFEIVEETHSVTVNGRDAFRAVGDIGDNIRMVFELIDYGEAKTPSIMMVIGLGTVDEFPMTQSTVTAVAESIQLLPSQ
ncbi:MAG: hypothetical protein Q9P01_17065 [Anaerolineae bacterium]|nr:hypothetical protein [Anaerolineae bacterium]MDQ7036473.1 hypothetical protein [Anaerolineae bacterium]